MSTFYRFEEIEAWKLARELTKQVYQVSRGSEFSRDFALRDQIRRSSVSIMANIAEGYERGGNAEFLQFLAISKASCGETRSHLYVALDQAFISPIEFEHLLRQCIVISGKLQGLMNSLRTSSYKGPKYKPSSPPEP